MITTNFKYSITKYLAIAVFTQCFSVNAMAFYEGEIELQLITGAGPEKQLRKLYSDNSLEFSNSEKFGIKISSCNDRKNYPNEIYIIQERAPSDGKNHLTYFFEKPDSGKIFNVLGTIFLGEKYTVEEVKNCKIEYCALSTPGFIFDSCIINRFGKILINLERLDSNG